MPIQEVSQEQRIEVAASLDLQRRATVLSGPDLLQLGRGFDSPRAQIERLSDDATRAVFQPIFEGVEPGPRLLEQLAGELRSLDVPALAAADLLTRVAIYRAGMPALQRDGLLSGYAKNLIRSQWMSELTSPPLGIQSGITESTLLDGIRNAVRRAVPELARFEQTASSRSPVSQHLVNPGTSLP